MEKGSHVHTVVAPIVYVRVYVALVALLALTYGVYNLGNRIHLNAVLAVVAALFIAVVKALLVVLFFMQVKYNSKLTWLWAALGFIWLLLMSGIITDYVMRAFRM